MPLAAALRDRLRAGLVAREQRRDPRLKPWKTSALGSAGGGYSRVCVICGWHGHRFLGSAHCESSNCPQCGSIARDRFLYQCFVRRVPYRPKLRVLEMSPRMGSAYERVMRERSAYLSSDFDLRAHKGDVALDLQHVGLADSSFDTILSAHVLEHLPDTDRALAELHRILRPEGTLLLAVPVLQGRTAAPLTPEYHGDRTLVYWRFGFDLTERLRAHGFKTNALVPQAFKCWVENNRPVGEVPGSEFDVASILEGANPADMIDVVSARESRRMGFELAYMFLAWECVKP